MFLIENINHKEKTMNLKQIDCAIELAHTLNFRQAAQNLFMSQPTLTYQIQTLEEEIGFTLFYRSGKGAALTPAGNEFCSRLSKIRQEITTAIETGRNYSHQYKVSLTVSVPLRSALYFLPHIMKQFQKEFPDVLLNIKYIYGNERVDSFLRGDEDIIFGQDISLAKIPHISLHKLFDSHIYLVTQKSDILSSKKLIKAQDLEGRFLMVGGGSPAPLQKAQEYIISHTNVQTINSDNHMTTLTNIAAGNGVCLCPGFTNDHLGEFAWIPFDTKEYIGCVLGTHKDDHRVITKRFIEIATEFYKMSAIQL